MIDHPVPFRRVHKRAVPVSETIEGWVFVIAVALTVYLVKTDAIAGVLVYEGGFGLLGAFFSGALFTSMLTAVPATYAIIESAQYMPAWQIALAGGAGSVVGDLVMFRLLRSSFSDHLLRAALHPAVRRLGRVLSSGPLWWTAPVFGAFAFASPLPDEIGVVMMGLSRMRPSRLVLFAFVTHVVGIYVIAILAQAAL